MHDPKVRKSKLVSYGPKLVLVSTWTHLGFMEAEGRHQEGCGEAKLYVCGRYVGAADLTTTKKVPKLDPKWAPNAIGPLGPHFGPILFFRDPFGALWGASGGQIENQKECSPEFLLKEIPT